MLAHTLMLDVARQSLSLFTAIQVMHAHIGHSRMRTIIGLRSLSTRTRRTEGQGARLQRDSRCMLRQPRLARILNPNLFPMPRC